MTTPVLEVEGLHTHYVRAGGSRFTPAVDGISLSLSAGESLGIVGESGSGKSTLGLSLVRLLPPAGRIVAGHIRLDGDDIMTKSEAEMRRIRGQKIAMILQDPMTSLNPLLTVGLQVAEPIQVHQRASRSVAWDKARGLLRAVRVADPDARMGEYPHQMSGGMRQRIVGAIAISCEPRVLIADEPTTSLDLTIQAQYLRLLKDVQQEHGLAMIFITHNLGIVARMCQRLAVMYAGRIVEMGPVRTIFGQAAHPYTKALLDSIPRVGAPRSRLTAIEGQPPDPAALPAGCRFHPRCPFVMDVCRTEEPPDVPIGPDHTARCWLGARP